MICGTHIISCDDTAGTIAHLNISTILNLYLLYAVDTLGP